jgi:plastocyanin
VRTQRLVICTVLAASLAACGSSESGDATAADDSVGVTSSVDAAGSSTEVIVQNYAFPAITATPGATLSLVDRDDEPHTITADDGSFKAGPFNSDEPGQLVVPTKAGSYAIHCDIHPTMHGTLVVNDPNATPDATPTPASTPIPADTEPIGYGY